MPSPVDDCFQMFSQAIMALEKIRKHTSICHEWHYYSSSIPDLINDSKWNMEKWSLCAEVCVLKISETKLLTQAFLSVC